MSLTDWCFVMDQVSGLRMLRSWGLSPQPQPRCDDETGIMNTLRTASCFRRHHQWSSESEMRTFGSSMWSNHLACSSQLGCYLWLEMWQHRVCIERERGDIVKTDILGASLTRQTEASLARCTDSIYITLSQGIQSPEIYNPSHIFRRATARKWQNIIPDRE